MATGYYLQDHPNPNTAQYGWERARLNEPGVHLSGVVGVHTSEAPTDFEGPDFNAENNAAFLARRADHGSYTTSADYDSIVHLVHPRYAAWADTTNNAHAMSVSGCLQAARWLEMTPERRRAVVVNMGKAAAEAVLTAVRDGYLAYPTPAVRISPAEAISGSRPGFYGHGETNPGTRYDPGAHFDWDLFLASYAAAVGGINPAGSIESAPAELAYLLEDDMWILAKTPDNDQVWRGNGGERWPVWSMDTLRNIEFWANKGAINVWKNPEDGSYVQTVPDLNSIGIDQMAIRGLDFEGRGDKGGSK